MPQKIERLNSVTGAYTVTASAATSPKVPFGAAGGGAFIVDAVTGGANSLSWYMAFGPEATPAQASDGTNDITTSIVAGKAYSLPDALFGAPYLVAVTNAGTATIRLSVKG